MIYKKDIYVVKEHDAEGSVNSVKNGGFIATDTYSVYPNGFFRCSNDGRYTKHIYIGAERIASQVGGKPYPSPNTESVSVAGRSNGIDIRVDYSGKLDQHLAQIDSVYDAFDLPYNGTNHDSYYNNYCFDRPGYWDNTEGMTLNGGEPEMPRSIQDRDLLYYYHRDHLGSSTAVSNDDGKLSQQIEYLPYGEVFLKKQMASSDYHSLYKFNGKELDEETGLYYYGARYMNPRLSIWYGTDPLEEKYPNISSYTYCACNPINLFDKTGLEPTEEEAVRIAAHVYGDKTDNILIGGWRVSKNNFGIKLKDATGLKSLVYERVVNNRVTEYVYATAGTENIQDWMENLEQPLGESLQYHNAANNAKKLSEVLKNEELNYVGHSLGGGEAALNSLLTYGEGKGRKAFTFNAAGVGDLTKIKEGSLTTRYKSENSIEAYILRTDPLNIAQNSSLLMPDVNGRRHYLWPRDLPSTYNGHSIDSLLKCFGVSNPGKYNKSK